MSVPNQTGPRIGARPQDRLKTAMKHMPNILREPARNAFPERARRVARASAGRLALVVGAAVAALGLASAQPAFAQQSAAPEVTTSDISPAYEERFRKLSEELRCLVCQNQTLADSHAELAGDLRREVQAQMEQGKSDEEIKAYLVARYGDFVLYRPPVQSNTMLLWFGPFALLLVGAAAWLVVQRRSRRRRAEAPATAEDDRERARKMLE